MATKIQQKTQELIVVIKKFQHCEKQFKSKSIKLVKELIDLHRIKKKDYTFCNLIQEKEFEDYSDVLDSYIPYDVSPLVNDQYLKGRLTNTDMMVLKHTDKEFKKPELQRKIVENIITGKIDSKELIRATKNEIREMIGEETDEWSESRKMIIQSVYHINHATKFISENKKELKILLSKKDKQKLKENFFTLKNVIQFGLRINLNEVGK